MALVVRVTRPTANTTNLRLLPAGPTIRLRGDKGTHRARVSVAGRHQRRDHQPTHPPEGAGGDEHSATTRTPGASVESHWVFWRLWCAPGFARVETAKLATSPRSGEAIVAPRLAPEYTIAGQRLFVAERVAATDQRRRSGAPSGRRADRGGASWRFGARCGNGSPPSCAWGAPRWRSGRTSSPRTRRGGPAWRPSTRRSMTARWGCARVSVCAAAAAAGAGDRDNAAGQRGARRRRTSPGDQTRSTTAARAGTGKATRSSAPTTARR